MKIAYSAIILLIVSFGLKAQQGFVKGNIKEQGIKQAVIGASVSNGNGKGTISDENGNYILELSAGPHDLEFRFLGYNTITKKITITENDTVQLDVAMGNDTKDLGLVVVSSSKYEKKIDEEIVSMEVLKQSFVEDYNAVTADKAITRIPGVNLVGDQINIRGGSGYSGGAGSRVLVLLDGLPYAAANNGSPDLNSLPMENLEQIEVIKGAASSIYGSSALNGVINVRSAWPKDEPYSKLTLFFGAYNNPFSNGKKHLIWWENRPMFGGVNFAHRKKFENFDFVVGGSYNEDQGYLYKSSVKRARTYIKTRWRPKKVENLSLGLNANLASTGGDFFFLWNNYGDTTNNRVVPNSLKPFIDEKCGCLDSLAYTPKEIGTFSIIPIALDPHITYFDKKNNMHSLKGRYYFTRQRSNTGEDTDATSAHGEYTFHTHLNLGKIVKFDVVTGLMAIYGDIDSKISNKRRQNNAATFAQFDTKLFDKLTLTIGGRVEYIQLDTLKAFWKPIFRGGLNFQAAEGTYIRASAGQGFRYPSVSEMFTTVIRNGITVIPNDTLKEETSWSAELGVKQAFKISKWYGYVDVAGFLSRYFDMIDFAFAPGVSLNFQAQNLIDTAQIAGFELSTIAQGNLFNIPFSFLIGYTYLDARELTDAAKNNKNRENFLNYRTRHSAKGDAQATYKRVVLGLTYTYNSFMVNIDDRIGALPGIAEFRTKHNKGQAIFDVRLGCTITDKFKLMLLAKNILNTQYSIRPAFIEPPRNYTVQLSYDF